MTPPIIAAINARKQSCDAIQLAAELAKGIGAPLEAATVLDYAPLGVDLAPHEVVLGDEYARIFRQASEQQPDVGFAENRLTGPSPPRVISELADELSAQLIAVGSTHTGRVGRILTGSTADRLLSGGSTPVAIAPRGYSDAEHRIGRIGVGFDGREEAHSALAYAADLARSLPASLSLLAVLPPPPVWSAETITGPLGFQDAVRADLESALERGSNGVEGIETETTLLEGDPASCLAGQSEELDLLVVGSRGYGPVGRTVLGDVASPLTRSTACPLIVVPRGWAGSPSEATG
jgi:nucleotide-binding universal stress UspA family protein